MEKSSYIWIKYLDSDPDVYAKVVDFYEKNSIIVSN